MCTTILKKILRMKTRLHLTLLMGICVLFVTATQDENSLNTQHLSSESSSIVNQLRPRALTPSRLCRSEEACTKACRRSHRDYGQCISKVCTCDDYPALIKRMIKQSASLSPKKKTKSPRSGVKSTTRQVKSYRSVTPNRYKRTSTLSYGKKYSRTPNSRKTSRKTPRKTLRKTPRKIPRKTPRKIPRKTPRKTPRKATSPKRRKLTKSKKKTPTKVVRTKNKRGRGTSTPTRKGRTTSGSNRKGQRSPSGGRTTRVKAGDNATKNGGKRRTPKPPISGDTGVIYSERIDKGSSLAQKGDRTPEKTTLNWNKGISSAISRPPITVESGGPNAERINVLYDKNSGTSGMPNVPSRVPYPNRPTSPSSVSQGQFGEDDAEESLSESDEIENSDVKPVKAAIGNKISGQKRPEPNDSIRYGADDGDFKPSKPTFGKPNKNLTGKQGTSLASNKGNDDGNDAGSDGGNDGNYDNGDDDDSDDMFSTSNGRPSGTAGAKNKKSPPDSKIPEELDPDDNSLSNPSENTKNKQPSKSSNVFDADFDMAADESGDIQGPPSFKNNKAQVSGSKSVQTLNGNTSAGDPTLEMENSDLMDTTDIDGMDDDSMIGKVGPDKDDIDHARIKGQIPPPKPGTQPENKRPLPVENPDSMAEDSMDDIEYSSQTAGSNSEKKPLSPVNNEGSMNEDDKDETDDPVLGKMHPQKPGIRLENKLPSPMMNDGAIAEDNIDDMDNDSMMEDTSPQTLDSAESEKKPLSPVKNNGPVSDDDTDDIDHDSILGKKPAVTTPDDLDPGDNYDDGDKSFERNTPAKLGSEDELDSRFQSKTNKPDPNKGLSMEKEDFASDLTDDDHLDVDLEASYSKRKDDEREVSDDRNEEKKNSSSNPKNDLDDAIPTAKNIDDSTERLGADEEDTGVLVSETPLKTSAPKQGNFGNADDLDADYNQHTGKGGESSEALDY